MILNYKMVLPPAARFNVPLLTVYDGQRGALVRAEGSNPCDLQGRGPVFLGADSPLGDRQVVACAERR